MLLFLYLKFSVLDLKIKIFSQLSLSKLISLIGGASLNKTIIFAIFMAIVLSLTSCTNNSKVKVSQNEYAIFLVKGDLPGTPDINKLSLEEKPFLSSKDIIKYYWDEQRFVTPKNLISEKLNNKISSAGVPFVVSVGDKRMYIGKFMSPASSLSYSPNIMVEGIYSEDLRSLKPDKNEQSYVLRWNDSDKDLSKKISDKRIYDALKSSGILDK